MSSVRISNSIRTSALALGMLVGATGCFSTKNAVTLSSLDTTYPVSASTQYVDGQGSIVTAEQYQVIEHFDFVSEAKGPRHEETTSKLDLTPEFNKIMARTKGDAITRTRIDVNYEPGSHYTAGGLKIIGWDLCVFSVLPFALIPVAQENNPRGVGTLAAIGGTSLGLGALFLVLAAFTTDKPSVWKFHLTGDVVRRQSSPVPSALP